MASGSPATDVVLHNAVVVTMDGALRVLRDGAIAVAGDRIAAVGPSTEILAAFPGAAQILDLGGRIVLPGLVNTHVHTSQQLARGIADDVDLMTWLHGRIWPYESHMTEEDSYASTLLCGIELIRSGSQKELYQKHHNTADGRIRIWFGLRQIMNATYHLLLETRDVAQKLNTGIHMHIAEIPYENQLIVRTKGVDHGTVTYLEKIDFLRSNLLAAHSVWLNEPEIGHFSKAGVKVSHCPASAMRMLGFAPIREMLDSGVCVSLGTDGAPSNNRMSIVDEMYLASLINKGREAYIGGTTNPTVLPSETVLKMATTVLKMATINGAKAVLWDNEIGSLEVGKKADLVVVNPFTWSMVPLHDSIANIVYCMRTENIESVMCNGQWIMKDHKIMNVNELIDILEMTQIEIQYVGHQFGHMEAELKPAPRGMKRSDHDDTCTEKSTWMAMSPSHHLLVPSDIR
ncbi:hypothetical protein PR202_gb23726 [Eleusine coracana subsp. coracana]|uniref:Amidohydrolase-related domain-containing protein n=1 Tax=Eleusine coracana subsp. coracana TaxID=191504 RepID=A0AAV5FKM6_ELECO|nr:hypothetical protein PR202_gb23726 [Eleusine coracana subsp. coracana]